MGTNGYRGIVSRRPPARLLLVVIAACFTLVAVAAAPAATRKPAPKTVGPTVTGGLASLAKMRGKPVFINVWSSW
jgi:hypothetical protein